MSEALRRAIADPGYTPPVRAFADLVALLGDPELAAPAERALRSAGLAAAAFAAETLRGSSFAQAPALVRLVGRALREHDSPVLLEALTGALECDDAETRRQAAISLGKSGCPAAEPALIACLSSADPKLLRSVVEALGKIGGERSLASLRALSPPAKLAPVMARAQLILERTTERAGGVAGAIALDVALPRARQVVLSCRAGLSELLVDEARPFGARRASDSEAQLDHRGTLRPLLSLRLARSVSLAWPLSAERAAADSVLEALLQPELSETLQAWTAGSPRFRLVWVGRGHRRSETWKIAQGLRAAGSNLKNDPTRAPWRIEVCESPTPRLLLTPVGAPDPRFEYRARDVPAASHPTVAAALARLAGVHPDDVVWDPFAGSGTELIERAKLGAYRELHGTDVDARALEAARENTGRAGLESARLEQADAGTHRVPRLTLVLTNPPMGRRVHRARGLSDLLRRVVRNVASQLAPGGRMVWLSPFADATAREAEQAGLRVERLGTVDLGGFRAELQRFTR